MSARVISTVGVPDLSSELLLPNGKLRLMYANELKSYPENALRIFCHRQGRYGLPTIELIDYIKKLIGDRNAIEIGCGHGDLGYHLGIPITDSHIQSDPQVKLFYMMGGQPVIEYPNDVEKLEALEAIKKYKPQVVVGSWITRWVDKNKQYAPGCHGSIFGVKEHELLRMVDTYIMVGNLEVHKGKPIFNRPHKEIEAEWIVSRAQYPEKNRIFIWSKKNASI